MFGTWIAQTLVCRPPVLSEMTFPLVLLVTAWLRAMVPGDSLAVHRGQMLLEIAFIPRSVSTTVSRTGEGLQRTAVSDCEI